MSRARSTSIAIAAILSAIFFLPVELWADNPAGAGTLISNRAEVTYQDATGDVFETVSPVVTVTVLAVASIVVAPDETTPSDSIAPHERISRLFTVCNTGNTADTFKLARAAVTSPATINALYFDIDRNGTLSTGDLPIILNDTSSPQLPPGGCLGVLAVIETNDVVGQSTIAISITARSNSVNAVNGRSEDDGMIINAVGQGPRLTDSDDPSQAPSKLVNGLSQLVTGTDSQFTYTISFRNSGDSAARNLVVRDELPAGVEFVFGSLQLDEHSLSDALDGDEGSVQNNIVEVRLARVNPNEAHRITLRARISGAAGAGTGRVNSALITADNAPAARSRAATVVINPFGVVFAGRAGSSVPIAGARVEVLIDQANNSLRLPPNAGFVPNASNENPFATDGQGRFTFALAPDQIGSAIAAANYFMRITAEGFMTRLIQINLRPAQSGLFTMTVHALDNQPLAVAAGFDLVREDVSISDLAALVMNIPMFEPSGLRLVKSADRARAEIGDIVTYRIEVTNPTAASVNDIKVRDHLPPSFHYAPGSGRIATGSGLEGPLEPEIQAGELLFPIRQILHGATVRLLYRVRVGANARGGAQENLAAAAGLFPSGERTETVPGRAVVFVSAGIFSTTQVIVGRVFVDVDANGQFDDNDRPMPNVRLYLSNGQSVITDSAGLYNFPSLGDGSQVISLDPVSVPPGYALSDGGRLSGKSWTRLLRTPIGGGALLRQNFALVVTARQRLVNSQTNPQKTDDPDQVEAAASPKPAATPESIEAVTKGPGTYEVAPAEHVAAVTPGDVRILSPASGSVSMSPGLQIQARVALNWTLKLEVNGEQISDKNIGVRAVDHKNQVSTFTYVGINLRPGPNRIRCTAISPEGGPANLHDIMVMGRGTVQRLEVIPEKTSISAGGRDSTVVKILAFDKWNHPASDTQVGIETSLGELLRMESTGGDAAGNGDVLRPGTVVTHNDLPLDVKINPEQQERYSHLVLSLDKGEARVRLIGSGATGDARLRALTGQLEAESLVRVIAEMRPTIMVGLAEMSFGNAIPEVSLRGEQGKSRNHISLFYSGRLWRANQLTLAYDSQRPINRTTGHDRLFQLDALDRVYPLYGDSSVRYEAAQSNSKLYARVDHNRSYAMFGDLDADMEELALGGYTRKLTGVKLRLENSASDFLTLTGARPDTSFAREVFPAGDLSLMHLAHGEILQGSETVALEVRDRRNPEIILTRELLVRSVDYNLNAANGELFLLRNISTFDSGLNLQQIVVTYEHQAGGMNSSVYTARGRKSFTGWGLKLGFSTVLQQQEGAASFLVGGFDAEKRLPRRGLLKFAWATSQGEITNGFVGSGGNNGDTNHIGNAFSLDLQQPLNFGEGIVRARYASASSRFLNPFGSTVTPGSRRGEVTFDFKPRRGAVLRLGLIKEDNQTANVDNNRLTFSVAGVQTIHERVRLHLGYDHRSFADELSNNKVDSNLVTVGAQVQATEKLDIGIKREQNLGEADPTYPNQTTLSANYQITAWTKFFLTERLASAAIMPISDLSQTGFAATNARRETALGVESRFGKYTSVVGRYQLENGISGADSFAVFGLQNRLPVRKGLSLELGFERGFHLVGDGKSFNSATLGFGWTPNDSFKASARYEFRDRGGNGQLIAIGAAGRLNEGITVLSRMQWSRSAFAGHDNQAVDGLAALAIRPLKSDRAGLLFSFNHRAIEQSGLRGAAATRDRLDTSATDGYYQATRRLELYGRFALRLSANGEPALPYVSTMTFLTQTRAQYRLTTRFDLASEMRLILQPSSQTQRSIYGNEIGFWALPDLRAGVGYNFSRSAEPGRDYALPRRQGFYFTISSKLSNLFDLFGTSKAGLQGQDDSAKTGARP